MIPAPKNETTMHYILKCLGFIILRGLGCKFVMTEYLLTQTYGECGINVDYNGRKVVDVLGLYPSRENDKPIIRLRSIEAKATYEDFKSGYTLSGADYMYLIAPKGIIPIDKIIKHYGLIEINFDKLHYVDPKSERLVYPVWQGTEGWYRFSKKPKRLPLTDYQRRRANEDYMITDVAIRNTSELQRLFERSAVSWIPDIKSCLDRPPKETITEQEIKNMKFI